MTVKSVSFVGTYSGDHECFCWDVSREEIDRVEKIFDDDSGPRESWFNEGLYVLYPDTVLWALGVKSCDKRKYKFTVSAEEIPE